MFDLLKTANDDQMAFGICILALAGIALFLFASFHLGPAGQKIRAKERKKFEFERIPHRSTESDRHQERAA